MDNILMVTSTIDDYEEYKKFCESRFYSYFSDFLKLNQMLKERDICVVFVQTPLYYKIEGLTDTELYRIGNWKFDFNNISESDLRLIKKVYNEKKSVEYVQKLYDGTKVYEKENIKYLADFVSEYVNIVAGKRYTSYCPKTYTNKIWIYGQCTARGIGVEDCETIASFLQEILNNRRLYYKVENCAVGCGSDIHDDIAHVKKENMKAGDIVIFCTNLEIVPNKLFKENSITYFDSSIAFNRPMYSGGDWFTDSTFHTTSVGNKQIANFIFKNLWEKKLLKNKQENFIYETDKNSKKSVQLKEKIDVREYEVELKEYLRSLNKHKRPGIKGSVVMNCNPFTLGHQYLIEEAAKQVDYLYVFVLSEDKSYFKYNDRLMLVKKGTEHIPNVIVLNSGKFIISAITFPGYFYKENNNNIRIDASYDLNIFGIYVAKELDISIRFAGTEPTDKVTAQYNRSMADILPMYNIEFREIARKEVDDKIISASKVREYFEERNFSAIKKIVPKSTYDYLKKKVNYDR